MRYFKNFFNIKAKIININLSCIKMQQKKRDFTWWILLGSRPDGVMLSAPIPESGLGKSTVNPADVTVL